MPIFVCTWSNKRRGCCSICPFEFKAHVMSTAALATSSFQPPFPKLLPQRPSANHWAYARRCLSMAHSPSKSDHPSLTRNCFKSSAKQTTTYRSYFVTTQLGLFSLGSETGSSRRSRSDLQILLLDGLFPKHFSHADPPQCRDSSAFYWPLRLEPCASAFPDNK